ncbi:class I SAM-dependent methyltransferase [Streptomyces sp. QH1-20]|uniref:class I SAM-dependent methyltransferase n=1 Tax=Streptomyces sp. QH1-20 TaxID=3240934 RepID=UPI003517F176
MSGASKAREVSGDWPKEVASLVRALRRDAAWLEEVAVRLTPGRRRLVDVGCGAGGMALALSEAAGSDARVVGLDGEELLLAHARRLAAERGFIGIQFVSFRLEDGVKAFHEAVGCVPDLIWASHVVHHTTDQQETLNMLATALAPGGQLAICEGGLPMRFLPWDVGLGRPGLEARMEVAQDRRFARRRDDLPGAVPMPYGWCEALRRAGLRNVMSIPYVIDNPAPPGSDVMIDVLDTLSAQIAKLTESDLLDEADAVTWGRLLDPDDSAWLGTRDDVHVRTLRQVVIGERA